MNKDKMISNLVRFFNLISAFILMFSPILGVLFFIIPLLFPLKIKSQDILYNKIYSLICIIVGLIFIIIN